MVEISTSILNVEKENAMKVFYGLEVAHTDYFHIDVMDGKLEPNIITFHLEAAKSKEEVMELINYIKENNVKVRNISKTKHKNRRDI